MMRLLRGGRHFDARRDQVAFFGVDGARGARAAQNKEKDKQGASDHVKSILHY